LGKKKEGVSVEHHWQIEGGNLPVTTKKNSRRKFFSKYHPGEWGGPLVGKAEELSGQVTEGPRAPEVKGMRHHGGGVKKHGCR